MRLALMILLSACAMAGVAAGAPGAWRGKARLLGRLAAHARHHKRGVAHIPTYKLGHDIPVVTHSLLKPLVVTYPPAAEVTAVKVPLHHHPLAHRAPHPHFTLKYPHHKAVLPDSHFHHHHHHVSPRPLVPLLPAPPPLPTTPLVPFAQPSASVAHPAPAPPPAFLLNQVPAPQPLPVGPPLVHVHPRPALPAAPLPAPALAPAFPLAPQYVLRPGNAVQTSYFATFPRYPAAGFGAGVLLGRPAVFPAPHASFAPGLLLPTPAAPLQPAPPTVFFQPTPATFQAAEPPHAHLLPTGGSLPTPALPLDHGGWAPLPGPAPTPPHFVQAHGTQLLEHHTGDQQLHQHQYQEHQFQEQQYHNQLLHEQHQHDQQVHDQQLHHQQFHDQQLHEQQYHNQLLHEQHQHDQQVHDQQLHHQQFHDQQLHEQQYHNQLLHEQHQHDQQVHDQQLHHQQFHDQQLHEHQLHDQQVHEQQYHDQQLQFHIQQQLEHALHEQQQHGYSEQHAGQEYLPPSPQPAGVQAEYGAPQVEGRSGEEGVGAGTPDAAADDQPRFHNHIPLALQPPIDRAPEHFA